MARCLIIGSGCRGVSLGRELVARGHSVRGTTRDPARRLEIEAAGLEAVVGDPDRIATLSPALEHVTVACILLGSAAGSPERVAELHESRLEMLLTRMLDTTVRGIVYEAAGTAGAEILGRGARRIEAFSRDSRTPCAILTADPADPRGWTEAGLAAVQVVLEAAR